MIIKRKSTEEIKKKKAAKAREKQRKRMIRTKFGQAPMRHARNGLKSCILAVMAFVLLLLMILISFTLKGEVGILAGIAGILALVMAGYGLSDGIRGFKERDKNYITCKVGTVCNALLLLCMCGLFIRGLF